MHRGFSRQMVELAFAGHPVKWQARQGVLALVDEFQIVV